MNYNPDHYRALGVGETVHHGHHIVPDNDRSGSDAFYTHPAPVGREWIGYVVSESVDYTFLEPIAVIPKDTYASGAARSKQEGRGRFDLIPYEAMLSLAKRYEMGSVHFGDRNWERGQPLSRLLSSLRRHAHQVGYDYSEDHMGAVLWNAAAFTTIVERMRAGILSKEFDDIGYFLNESAIQGVTKP